MGIQRPHILVVTIRYPMCCDDAGSSGALPFSGNLQRQIVPRTGNDPQAQSQARSTGGRTKKVVRIPIE